MGLSPIFPLIPHAFFFFLFSCSELPFFFQSFDWIVALSSTVIESYFCCRSLFRPLFPLCPGIRGKEHQRRGRLCRASPPAIAPPPPASSLVFFIDSDSFFFLPGFFHFPRLYRRLCRLLNFSQLRGVFPPFSYSSHFRGNFFSCLDSLYFFFPLVCSPSLFCLEDELSSIFFFSRFAPRLKCLARGFVYSLTWLRL